MRVTVQLRSGAHTKRLRSLLLFMYLTYILYSEKCDRYYIGYCADMTARLQRHNAGMVAATRNCRPYVVKATKSFAAKRQLL